MRSWIRIAAFVWIVSLGLRASAQFPRAPTGRVLLISDIHLDPLADPSILKRLIAAPVARWTSIFRSSQRQSFSTYGSDPNYPLVSSALRAAAAQGPFDYVVFTGDALRHDFSSAFVAAGGASSQFPAFAVKTEVFVTRELQREFRVPVLSAIGNNDSNCGDYQIPPNSPFFAALADQLTVLMKFPAAKATFQFGGFFSVPHPRIANQDIIVLNSVFWSTSYSSCAPNAGDPGAAELDWLSWKLYAAKILHRGVTLVMHIPPGIDAFSSSRGANCGNAVPFWPDRYSTRFSALMQAYSDVVQLAFAGHTHMDDFRLSASKTRALPWRITPAISPLFNNNPGFSVLFYDLKTAAVSDFTSFFISLSSPTPQWGKEYQFSVTYGVGAFNADSLGTVAAGIRSGDPALRIFEDNYAVSAPSPISSSNWPYYSCAPTEFTETNYTNCVCGASSTRRKE
jgi:sphingomyelin phosphodiesterase acid-like 3